MFVFFPIRTVLFFLHPLQKKKNLFIHLPSSQRKDGVRMRSGIFQTALYVSGISIDETGST